MIRSPYARILLPALISITLVFGVMAAVQSRLASSFADTAAADRARGLADAVKPSMLKALEIRDDLLLVSLTESLMQSEGVETVYILDGVGRVVMHDSPGEWGRTHTIPPSAVNLDFDGVPFPGEESALYSTALGPSSERLYIGLSARRLRRRIGQAVTVTVTAGLICALLCAVGLTLLVRRQIAGCLGRLERDLDNTVPGSEPPSPASYGMFAGLVERIGRIMERNGDPGPVARADAAAERRRTSALVGAALSLSGRGLVIIGADNAVAAVNDRAREWLGAAVEGRHFLDVFPAGPVLFLIRRAMGSPGTPLSTEDDGHTCTACAVRTADGGTAGTILVVE